MRHFLQNNRAKKHWQVIFASGVLLFSGFIFLWAATLKIPDLGSFETRRVQNSTKIYDRTGKVLLYDIHRNIKRVVLPSSDMGVYIKNATVAIEDKDFYTHGGVRLTSIVRATLVNLLSGGYSQGGSTITQQVIKNAILTPEKKVSRKIKEWVLAVKLERVMSKEDILALYLNEAPYGGEVYGIGEAADYYFGKKPRDLTLTEAAYLAALPQLPTYYSPYGKNRDKLEERKNYVLARMRELDFITEGQYLDAKSATVNFLPQNTGNAKALHFVQYVREYLEDTYGKEALLGGLKVTTTLDYNLEKKAEDILASYAKENEKKFNAKNAALVAIDPKTGQILAMVGSRDYFDKEIDGSFNVALAHRQPGSAFKPIVYATAFMKGYTPETTLFDLETEFQTTCTPDSKPLPGTSADDCYMPENYDQKFRGPVTLRQALAQSINIPSIKLLYLAGIDDSLKIAQAMGIKSLKDKNQYGLTLVLGGGEVSLLDLTSAYGVFANNGARNPYEKILKVEDSSGRVLENWKPREEQVLPKEIVLEISDILSDNIARAPAFGYTSALYFPKREVAVKTGTTNDYRDAWIVGYTPSIAVGAWAGNNDNTPMEKKVAGFIVAPLWNAFMIEVLKELPDEKFEKPKKDAGFGLKPALRGVWWGDKNYLIDKISGGLATEYTPEGSLGELVIKDPHSILYFVDKGNPLGPRPDNPENDPQFRHWEYPVQKWLSAQNSLPGVSLAEIPVTYDNIHGPLFSPTVTIIEPSNQKIYQMNDTVGVLLKTSGRFPLDNVDFFLNNNFIGSSKNQNNFSFFLDQNNTVVGTNELRVVAYDSVYNSGQTSLLFTVRQVSTE